MKRMVGVIVGRRKVIQEEPTKVTCEWKEKQEDSEKGRGEQRKPEGSQKAKTRVAHFEEGAENLGKRKNSA